MNKNKCKQHIIVSAAVVIFVLCLLMVPIILLSGCAAEPSKEEIFLSTPDFTSPSEYGLNFIIDKNTFIVYLFNNGAYQGGLCPYYILDENGVPHMVKWENNKFVLLPNN